ncbi:T-cell activation inhibitor, mitochondrial-like [Glandiceps talaboti]
MIGMTMFSRKFRFAPMFRLAVNVFGLRFLTTAEASTALRPFYFAVHPDFFGQHPKERAVNETSLKKLNSYLEECLCGRHDVEPTTLTFYLRNNHNSVEIVPKTSVRTVNKNHLAVTFTLESSDVRTTVQKILKSCKIPTEYIKSIPNKGAFPRPIIWDPTYYYYTGQEPPADAFYSQSRAKPQTLRYWMQRNFKDIHKKLKTNKPLEVETNELSEELREELGLVDIVWHCGWGLSAFRACLMSFSRLCEQHRQDMEILRGRSLIFSSGTGVSRNGSIVLSSGDVHHHWLMLLGSFSTFNAILAELPKLEQAVSSQLGDIQIIRRESERIMLAEDYRNLLSRLLRSIVDYYRRKRLSAEVSEYSDMDYGDVGDGPDKPPSGMLKDLEMLVECDAGDVRLLSNGQFHVPASYPPVLLLEYMLSRQHKARLNCTEFARYKEEMKVIMRCCQEEHDLAKLTKDNAVSTQQMSECCQRLIDNPYESGVSLRGLNIKISQFYSLSEDGEICIPWDWKM